MMFVIALLSFLFMTNITLIDGWDGCTKSTKGQDCEIVFDGGKEISFTFTEVPEDFEVGRRLAKYQVNKAVSPSLVDSGSYEGSFADILYNNVDQYLEFYLKKQLSDYRSDIWRATIEIKYKLTCSITGIQSPNIYTFMIVVEDGNLYAPSFESHVYNVTVPFPWLAPFPLNFNKTITVTDLDYNPNHATVSFSCLGEETCKHFSIEGQQIQNGKDNSHGYSYQVNVRLLNNSPLNKVPGIAEGDIVSITIAANDSSHVSYATVNFIAAEVVAGSETSNFPPAVVVALGVVALLCVIFGGALIVRLRYKKRKTEDILRKLTEAEIREFLEGVAGYGGDAPKRSVDCNTPIMAKPYNKAFEIPRDRLRIDETTVLGTGFYGIVMKGSIIHPNGESTTVAVKAVKRNVGVLYFKALLSELKIMAHIGSHSNIVSLVGACTHNIRKREVFIAVEYCSNGNLHNYLKTNRTNFINLVEDGILCGFKRNHRYQRRGSYSSQISTLELVKWATQIASGLDYLSNNLGVIHGDLATRNVLLSSEKVAKIADFGLSRRLIDASSYYYTKQSQAPLPWKWMSIESLKDMKFSKKSDLWSYGIVLWEIFSLGQTPYPGLNWAENFVERLERGFRLSQPQYASNDLYEIMKDCWTENPHDRPSISDIKRLLEGMTNSLLFQNTNDEGYMRVLGGERYVNIGIGDIGSTARRQSSISAAESHVC